MRQSFSRAYLVLEAAAHLAYAGELRSQAAGALDGVNFAEVVELALTRFGVPATAIASKFGVTKATVSRWKNGEAVPGSYMRKEFFAWLADAVEELSDLDEVQARVAAQEFAKEACRV